MLLLKPCQTKLWIPEFKELFSNKNFMTDLLFEETRGICVKSINIKHLTLNFDFYNDQLKCFELSCDQEFHFIVWIMLIW